MEVSFKLGELEGVFLDLEFVEFLESGRNDDDDDEVLH